MDKKCVSIIRIGDFIIYRNDFPASNIKFFEDSNLPYIECEPSKFGNIYYNEYVYLQEWTKYKVKSILGTFKQEDFFKKGEFFSENYGYLIFKNCVGYACFKSQKFIIESSKISLKEFNELAQIVNSYISNLSYDFNNATALNVYRNYAKRTDLDYHLYLLLYNAFLSTNNCSNIFENIKLIQQNPCRNFVKELTNQRIDEISNFNDDVVTEMFSAQSEYIPIVSLSLKKKLKNLPYLSKDVMIGIIDDSFDNIENQFIKFFLIWSLSIIQLFQARFLKLENFANEEYIRNNERIIKKIKTILNQSFFKEVGNLSIFPMYSSVLTRRDGYRQIFNLFMGIKSIPVVEKLNNLQELIENKPIDILYENYCFFSMAEIISQLYNEKINTKKYKIYKNYFSKTLSKKTKSNYFEFLPKGTLPKIRLHYNKNYTIESYSNPYDPDISIEILDKNDMIISIYFFDAKFRIQNEQKEQSDVFYNVDDINKMHTYRDAIKQAEGAYILYPGTKCEIFYAEEKKNKCFYSGVGAFPFRPLNVDDKNNIKRVLEEILQNYYCV